MYGAASFKKKLDKMTKFLSEIVYILPKYCLPRLSPVLQLIKAVREIQWLYILYVLLFECLIRVASKAIIREELEVEIC